MESLEQYFGINICSSSTINKSNNSCLFPHLIPSNEKHQLDNKSGKINDFLKQGNLNMNSLFPYRIIFNAQRLP